MSALVFQILDENETVTSRGFPEWIFWFMVVVIAILVIFILIRDRGVREKIKKFFSWFFNKIRVARLKSQTNRLSQKKTLLIAELGKTLWEKNIELEGAEPEKQEINNLKRDEGDIQHDIQELDGEIDKKKSEADGIDKSYQEKVAEVEKKKDPLDRRYRELDKAARSLQDQIKDQERTRQKVERSVQQHRQEIERIDSDEYLSKKEKELKRKEQEKEIGELQMQGKRAEEEIGSLKQKGDVLGREINKLKVEISDFRETIDRFKTENQSYHQKNDELIDQLQKSRKALGIKKIGIQKQLSLTFEKVGQKVNQSRIENKELNPLFGEIDQLDKQIRELENRMKKS